MTTDPTSATDVPTCYRHPGRESHIRCQRCDRPICPDCMRDAAVGFQCPACVAEGSRATRSGRTAYGGLRSANPGLTSAVLVALNVAVFLLIRATGGAGSVWVERLALWREDFLYRSGGGIVRIPGVADGAYWQLLTNAFTHVAVWHIALNMLGVWFLGPHLEAIMGRARFLALYLGSALAASTLVYWTEPLGTPTLGASGALFGMLGALIVAAVRGRGDVRTLLFWLGLNVVFTFVFPNISWAGHLGGLVGGLVIGVLIIYAPRRHRTAVQLAGGVVVAGLLVAAIVVRTQSLTG